MKYGENMMNTHLLFPALIVYVCLIVFTCGAPFMTYSQECNQTAIHLDWAVVPWQQGIKDRTLELPIPDQSDDNIEVSIDISTQSSGSFEAFDVISPYIDGRDIANFGDKMDLGIMFDPAANQGLSPIVIKMRFSRPVQCVEFEVSDIDIAGGRVDSLVVFGNGGTIRPALAPISATPTVGVSHNSARALGAGTGRASSGSAYGNDNQGNIKVTFGSELLDSITIVYFEASGSLNPSARGIGVFGDLSFYVSELKPANLLKFGVILDDICQPVVRWMTNQEFGIDEYEVDYSYDGYNFFRAGAVPARNQYTSESEYEVALYRKLNTDNFFRLVKIDNQGNKEILAAESMSGAECFQFTSVNVYPNPSTGNFVFVEIEATDEKETEIAIIDQYGELLVQTRYQLKRGQNVFKLASRHLVPGVYNLRFSIEGEIVTKRVSIVD